jgi:CIC family chloride channel protein
METSAQPRRGNPLDSLRHAGVEQLQQHEEKVFLILSLLIGALTGVVVSAFILLTERMGMQLYPVEGAAWRRVAIPIAGSLAMGFLLYRFFPNARGSGVPQTKAAMFARDGFISLRTVLGKFFCTSVTLASGIPLGREGPSVQVGAGMASVLGRSLGLRPERIRQLIPVGAAAAVAAAFNTPMAAVLFALEEVMGDLHAPVLGSVVLASATSWATMRMILGDNPLFHVPDYHLVHPLELGIYAILGIVGGFLSVAFTQSLLRLRKAFARLPKRSRWVQPVAGGVCIGLIGWFVPQALGVGYSWVGQALNSSMALKMLLLLVVLKLVGVVVAYASGNAGGIFGPSLFLGAMLGGVIGTVAHQLLPGYTANPGAYALVGMGVMFAGIVRAPMTSVLMIFEMTRDYEVIVPLMIANLLSLFIARQLQPQPIYEALSEQDGIHLPAVRGKEDSIDVHVESIMRAPAETLGGRQRVREALIAVQPSAHHIWPVLRGNFFLGIVTREELERAAVAGKHDQRLENLVEIENMPHLHRDHPLHLALARMSAAHLDLLPVIHRADVHKLEGVVSLQEVLEAYGVQNTDAAQL